MIELQEIRAALAREEPRLLPEPAEGRARACVAAVLAGPPGDLSLCFIQRAAHPDDPWSEQMGLPGGRAEEGDPSPRDVAICETREELGLDLERAEYIGRLSEVPIRPVIHAGGVLSPSASSAYSQRRSAARYLSRSGEKKRARRRRAALSRCLILPHRCLAW